jgi:hypothetical protein
MTGSRSSESSIPSVSRFGRNSSFFCASRVSTGASRVSTPRTTTLRSAGQGRLGCWVCSPGATSWALRRAEKVERWVVQRDAPVFRRDALEPDLLLGCGVSSGAGCSGLLAGVNGMDARQYRSYECCGKDVRGTVEVAHSGTLRECAAPAAGWNRVTSVNTAARRCVGWFTLVLHAHTAVLARLECRVRFRGDS